MGELGVMNSISKQGERPPGFCFGSKSAAKPDPASFSEDCLSAAEEAAEQVINCIHPTMDSEEKRRDVIDYVRRLIKSHLNCEVFSYGSVPLKTYLPDGDIDLTALQVPNADESLAHDVLALIQMEEQNEYSEYDVKDTHFIDAEVKLVKCLVRNIVVDISFNQLGGLSTLCFLEQVDQLVGRNHIFKRSIILVKAWCYYESRILGAHHGLLSTYALETLVLYIFQLFHSSLYGPLEVLYKFLDYYSQFDWENYCISMKGPVCKSSLPDLVVKMPEDGRKNMMLSEEFLENCIEMYAVPSKEIEGKPKVFQTKHLNIIDPLKQNNNLGRSVHRGNFYRIRSAFKYGARKLGQLLRRPKDKIANEINEFFSCTTARHGQQNTNNILQRSTLEFSDAESLTESFSSQAEYFSEDDILMKSSVSDYDFDSDSICLGEKSSTYKKEQEKCSGEAYDFTISNSSLRNDSSDHTSNSNFSTSASVNNARKPEDRSSKPSAGSASLETGNLHLDPQKFGFKSWLENKEKHNEMDTTHRWCMDSPAPMAETLDNLAIDLGELDLASPDGESEVFNPLADLTGEYEGHVRSLLYGQMCSGVCLSAIAASTSVLGDRTPWYIVRQAFPFTQNQYSQTISMEYTQMNSPTVSMEYFHMDSPTVPMEYASQMVPVDYSQMNSLTVSVDYTQMNSQTVHMDYAQMNSHKMDSIGYAQVNSPTDSSFSTNGFPSEKKHKARGTGTYLPNNGFFRDRTMHGRGRNKAPGNRHHFHKNGRSNGIYLPSVESNNSKTAPVRSWSLGRGRSEFRCQSPYYVGDEKHETIGHSNRGSCKIEFGSVGNLADEVISDSVNVTGSAPAALTETECCRGVDPPQE